MGKVGEASFIKVPYFHESSPALKNFWLRAYTQALLFLQNTILNV